MARPSDLEVRLYWILSGVLAFGCGKDLPWSAEELRWELDLSMAMRLILSDGAVLDQFDRATLGAPRFQFQ